MTTLTEHHAQHLLDTEQSQIVTQEALKKMDEDLSAIIKTLDEKNDYVEYLERRILDKDAVIRLLKKEINYLKGEIVELNKEFGPPTKR